jgi:hemerythrin
MPIQWSPRLAVGVVEIDEQHQELFRRVNTLLEAMAAARAKDELARIIAFLTDYVTQHFGLEARLMEAHRYPGAAEHLGQHAHFVTEFKALAAEQERLGPSGALAIKFNKLLCDWLRDHVATTDRKLGEFLATVRPVARA